MFELRYAWCELARRWPRSLLAAAVLAAAVAVAVCVGALSHALRQAQLDLVQPLRSVGADLVLVRRPEGPADLMPAALGLSELGPLGPPGSRFAVERVLPGSLPTFPGADLDRVRRVGGVEHVDGVLVAVVLRQEGTVPAAEAVLRAGGEPLAVEREIPPLTVEEQAAVADAVRRAVGELALRGVPPLSPEWLREAWQAVEAALPERYRRVRITVTTPQREVRQQVPVQRLDLRSEAWTALGISAEGFRRLVGSRLEEGRGLSGAPDEAVVTRGFARARGLRVGQELLLGGARLRVVGVVTASAAMPADLYLPLPTVQRLAGVPGQVNAALVRVKDNAELQRVRAELGRVAPALLPVTDADLGSQVARALADLSAVIDRFARASAAVAVAGALMAAAVLALASVERRLHEIGVLRALGWSGGSLVVLLVTEFALVGLLGGAAGVLAGWAALASGADLVLQLPGWAAPANRLWGGAPPGGSAGALVLHLRMSPALAVRALALAVLVGAAAGAAATWRALRLAPAEALRRPG